MMPLARERIMSAPTTRDPILTDRLSAHRLARLTGLSLRSVRELLRYCPRPHQATAAELVRAMPVALGVAYTRWRYTR
jgi:hypothetical protein